MQQHADEELSLISAYVSEHLLQTSAFILFCLNATTAVRVQKLINLQRTVALSTFIQLGISALSQRSRSPAHTVITTLFNFCSTEIIAIVTRYEILQVFSRIYGLWIYVFSQTVWYVINLTAGNSCVVYGCGNVCLHI